MLFYSIMKFLANFIPTHNARKRYRSWAKVKFSTQYQLDKTFERMKMAIGDPYGLGMADFIMFDCLKIAQRFANTIYSIPENALILDCGMNRGKFTDLCLLFKANIVGFEPNPILASFLHRKYSAESLVSVQNSAVANNAGNMTFAFAGATDDGASICPDFNRGNINLKTVQVDVINLAEYILSKNEQIFILKLDSEGAEFGLLEELCHSGAWKLCDHIFVETHADFFEDGKAKLESARKAIADVGAAKVIDLGWV
ncbi:MAG: FkbM family methyltransferase [Deferribacteraceae bacterium]|jgi:FkbM family methyltransferase|nr:FkbM family methyltransferase [Deferribacteraceae bacterium]